MFIRILIVLLLATVDVAQAECDKDVAPYLTASRAKHLQDLHNRGKELIPLLIRDIGDSGPAHISLARPSQSRLELAPVYCGTVAAYLIELILGRSELTVQSDSDFFLGNNPLNYVYDQEFVTISATGKPLSSKDLPKLRSAYNRWWRVNHDKDINVLRAEWRKGNTALSGSQFTWK